jgi:hypothetical protein
MKLTKLTSVALVAVVALGVSSAKAFTTTNFALLDFNLVALQQDTTTNKGIIKDSIQKTKLSNKEILALVGETLGITIPDKAELALDTNEDVVVLTNGAVFLNLDTAETTTTNISGGVTNVTYGYTDDAYLETYYPVYSGSAPTNGGFNSLTNTFKADGNALADGELYFDTEVYTNGVYASEEYHDLYFDYASTSFSYSQKDGNFKSSFEIRESGELDTYEYPAAAVDIYTPFSGTVKGKASGATARAGDLIP